MHAASANYGLLLNQLLSETIPLALLTNFAFRRTETIVAAMTVSTRERFFPPSAFIAA